MDQEKHGEGVSQSTLHCSFGYHVFISTSNSQIFIILNNLANFYGKVGEMPQIWIPFMVELIAFD